MRANDLVVFYCWQYDLPHNKNKDYIKDILEKVKQEIFEEISINIIIDEATRDLLGSDKISHAILEKIQESDIFICDVSIINNGAFNIRPVSNPNVLFELGCAVSFLNWERIILVFNEEFGALQSLPFDLEKHRTTLYNSNYYNLDTERHFINSIKYKIIAIWNQNPIKGYLSPKTREIKIKYKKDIENIEKFLRTFLISLIDQHVENAPREINTDIYSFFEEMERLLNYNSYNFKIYNNKLKKLISLFFNYWKNSLPINMLEEGYYHHVVGNRIIFSNPCDAPLNGDQEIAWNRMRENKILMHKYLYMILELIRNEYIEIDISLIQNNVYQNFINMKKEYKFD
jgi:hypothetical protein